MHVGCGQYYHEETIFDDSFFHIIVEPAIEDFMPLVSYISKICFQFNNAFLLSIFQN